MIIVNGGVYAAAAMFNCRLLRSQLAECIQAAYRTKRLVSGLFKEHPVVRLQRLLAIATSIFSHGMDEDPLNLSRASAPTFRCLKLEKTMMIPTAASIKYKGAI